MVRHSKDRLFITATEWREQYGGKQASRTTATARPLPFDHCALSLSPFVTPVLLGTGGAIFDMEAIVPYIQQYKCDPVTGEKVTTKNIVRLNMEKNADGKWHCPITCKVFNDSTHVVAIRTTGNVYAYDAVRELNIKAKNFTDLISGEKFEKSDIVTLLEPLNPEQMAKRDINSFVHLKQVREDNAEARKSESKVRHNPQTASIMKEVEAARALEKETGVKRKTLEDIVAKASDAFTEDVARFLALRPTTQEVNPGQVNTDGRASSSLMSSAVAAWTSNATRLADAEEIREARWRIMREMGKKGYVQLQTTSGNLNLEIHCDIAMRTAWNFLTLCSRGYYDGVVVHRLIKGFMAQTGDPTGSGAGGESAFGRPFRDEFDTRLQHDSRGVLSMANAGENSNNSQFFITFKEARHLDLKHSVFGRVVGGLAVLDALEAVKTDKQDRPLEEERVLKAVVFTNPIDEADTLLEEHILRNRRSQRAAAPSSALPEGSAGAIGGGSSSSSSSSSSDKRARI